MGRLLVIVIGAFIIYLLLKGYFRNLQRPAGPHPETHRSPVAENMVRCAHCSVNIPKTEAIFSRGEFFCTDEHRQQHQQ